MPRFARLAGTLLLAALAAGCAKKVTVDSAYQVPEGVPSSQLELVTYYDLPNNVLLLEDRGRIGKPDFVNDPVSVDSIVINPVTGQPSITPLQEFTPGTIHGLLMNRTSAEGMELFRSESNGGLRRVYTQPLHADRRFLDQLCETYTFTDDDPKRSSNTSYIARGLLDGIGGATSPLSNSSQPLTTLFTEITYTALRNGTLRSSGGVPPPAESTFMMQWTPVANTSRYWIHVFQYLPTLVGFQERVISGAPAPLVPQKTRDIFVASVPSNITTYKLGDPIATIYTYRTPHLKQEYYVRISAVDASGQLIGMTTGPTITQTSDLAKIQDARDYFTLFGTTANYIMFSRGAVRVSPGEVAGPTPDLATTAGRARSR
jgi:hypothetical protein